MKYTQIPTTTFQQLQLNAGILVDGFTPSTGTIGNLIGATSGGINFTATPTWKDFGDGIDNCPKNTKELKKLDTWEAKMTGTFAMLNTTLAKKLLAAADISSTKVLPRTDLSTSDFSDIWWIGDYSDKNGESNGGFVAIHLINGLSTGGFQIQTTDKDKGTFSFEFTAHYSMSDQSTVPFEIYIQAGSAEPTTVTMAYDSNGGTGTMTDSDSPYDYGDTVTVKANTFTKTGSTFSKWNTAADGSGIDYVANATFRIVRNTTLYAQWS